jgi:ATP-binding cassette subfamily C protein LapB
MENEAKPAAEEWKTNGIASDRDDPLLSCLIFLTRLENNPYSPDALVVGLPLENNKLTPELFPRAAERASMSAQVIKRPIKEISSLMLPVVLLLKDKQACVLLENGPKNTVKIVQPESLDGTREIKLKDLEELYSGFAIFARPTYRFDERAKESHLDTSKHWFWGIVSQTWPIYAEVIVASLFINLFSIISSLFSMNVYDRVVPNNAISTLWALAIGVLIVYVFDFILKNVRTYFIDVAGKKTDLILSAKIFEHMLAIRMDARPDSVGSFANTFQQFEGFREFFSSSTIATAVDLPFLVFFLIIVFTLGGPVGLVPLIAIPLVFFSSLIIQKMLDEHVKESQKFTSQKQALLYECLSGPEAIKSATAEGVLQRKWEYLVGHSSMIGSKVKILQQLAMNFSMFAQQIVGVFILVVGVYQIAEGKMTTGALVACTMLGSRALTPLSQVASLLTRYKQSMTSFTSVDNMMKIPTERPETQKPLHRPTLEGRIEFKNVSFKYKNQTNKVLDNINFTINPGEKVGIIGRIGSGKTTLEKLMMGFYEPSEGSVLYDNLDLRQLDVSTVRRNIGYIPQDIFLFFGSVKENIVFGAPYVSDDVILTAATVSGVMDFVTRHPKGFDMPVGEWGAQLSGGQRQVVAAARAMLKNPPILLFDEPTNMMDNKTEEMFKTRIATLVKDKTFILVTHKGAMLSLVDRLIVVDNGKIVADGPRDQVLQNMMAVKGQTTKGATLVQVNK